MCTRLSLTHNTRPRPFKNISILGSKREKDCITDWHNNSRKRSGVWEAGQICGHLGWCNENQNFLTPEPCDPQNPLKAGLSFSGRLPTKITYRLKYLHSDAHAGSNILPPARPRSLADCLNSPVRAVCLGSIDQMSCVVSLRLINGDYCQGYRCPQIKAYLCLGTGQPPHWKWHMSNTCINQLGKKNRQYIKSFALTWCSIRNVSVPLTNRNLKE